jgi:hypothetical protein
VELARRYSNRPDCLDDLNQVMVQLDHERGSMPRPIARWSCLLLAVTLDGFGSRLGRLSAEDRRALIDSYRGGATIHVLAERFSLGATSVKRILRDNKARRKDGA